MKRKAESQNNADKKRPKLVFRRGEKVNAVSEVSQSDLQEKRQDWIDGVLSPVRVRNIDHITVALYLSKEQRILVTLQKGKFFKSMGYSMNGKLYLQPEEALWLFERGMLQLSVDNVESKVFSIEEAFSLFLNTLSVETGEPLLLLDHFLVYSHLRKSGFALQRHNPKHYEGHRIIHGPSFLENQNKKLADVAMKLKDMRNRKTNSSEATHILVENNLPKNDNSDWWESNTAEGTTQVTSTDPEPETNIEESKIDKNTSLLGHLNHGSLVPLKKIQALLQIVQRKRLKVTGQAPKQWPLVFDVWTVEDFKKRLDKRPQPYFGLVITGYNQNFPPMQAIHELNVKLSPVPVYFAVVEGGHMSFMHLNSTFELPSSFES